MSPRLKLAGLCCAFAALGCGDAPSTRVTFTTAKGPIGKWEFPADAGADAGEDAGEPAREADAGMPHDAPVSTLSFAVTTAPLGGKYAPKNVGAIWVADPSGKLIKTLEVWASTRVRYLSEYNKVRAGMSIDVSSRATMSGMRAHELTWDLKDRSGALVPAGEYKLHLELTDTDSTGKTIDIDFDTSADARTSMPPDAACFSQMKLELK